MKSSQDAQVTPSIAYLKLTGCTSYPEHSIFKANRMHKLPRAQLMKSSQDAQVRPSIAYLKLTGCTS